MTETPNRPSSLIWSIFIFSLLLLSPTKGKKRKGKKQNIKTKQKQTDNQPLMTAQTIVELMHSLLTINPTHFQITINMFLDL